MDRLSNFVLAHRRWVFVFWLGMFLVGVVAAGRVSDRLSYNFALPGQHGYETEQKLIASYQGANAQVAYIPVVTVPEGQTVTGSADKVAAVYDALRQIPTLRVVDYSQTQDKGFITDDGRTTFGLIYEPQPQGFVDPNQKAVEDTFNAQLKQQGFTGAPVRSRFMRSPRSLSSPASANRGGRSDTARCATSAVRFFPRPP